MRRREFIAGLGSAAAWPLAARAQQVRRMRTLGILSGSAADDPNNRNWFSEFDAALQALGWTRGKTSGSSDALLPQTSCECSSMHES